MKHPIPSLIGVIHLPALPGAPESPKASPVRVLEQVRRRALKEALTLVRAGFPGLILENFGDVPFYRDRVPPETVAALAVIAAEVREAVKVPLGINVLRNDAFSALAIASVTGCDFIRVNVLAGVAATDQGLIQGAAAELSRERARLGSSVRILADAQVKHARSLSSNGLALEIEEIALRAGADGVIITGTTTGRFADASTLSAARSASNDHGIGIWIGSGASPETLPEIRGNRFGVIVGSTLRQGGRAGAPLDPRRIRAFLKGWKF